LQRRAIADNIPGMIYCDMEDLNGSVRLAERTDKDDQGYWRSDELLAAGAGETTHKVNLYLRHNSLKLTTFHVEGLNNRTFHLGLTIKLDRSKLLELLHVLRAMSEK
jgi:hypothetical protein